MIEKLYIGWVRDSKGKVVSRPIKNIANAITTFCGRGRYIDRDGLSNTSPHIIHVFY